MPFPTPSRAARTLCAIAALLGPVVAAGCARPPEFDIVISGGTVYEGSGQPPVRADVGISGDRIVTVGPGLSARTAGLVIDASGKAVAPGFINVNSRSGVTLLADGTGESHLRQGITTELLAGDTPASWTPQTAPADDVALLRRFGLAADWDGMRPYLARLEQRGTSSNVGVFTSAAGLVAGGAGTVQALAAALDADMQSGSFGVWIDRNAPALGGLDAGALTALATAVQRHNGSYLANLPTDRPLDQAVAEAIAMMQAAGLDGLGVTVGPETQIQMAGAAASMADLAWQERQQRSRRLHFVVDPYPLSPAAGIEGDLRVLIGFPDSAIGTGTAAVRNEGILSTLPVRPAAYGATARLLGHYVRDLQALPLVDALVRVTSLPAVRFRIAERGFVRPGLFADLVIFDPATVADRSTNERPAVSPTGIDYVIVNGVVTVTPAGHTGARAGRALRGPGFPRPTY